MPPSAGLKRNAAHLAGQRVTLLADDLHCNQPFCQTGGGSGLGLHHDL